MDGITHHDSCNAMAMIVHNKPPDGTKPGCKLLPTNHSVYIYMYYELNCTKYTMCKQFLQAQCLLITR